MFIIGCKSMTHQSTSKRNIDFVRFTSFCLRYDSNTVYFIEEIEIYFASTATDSIA